MNIFYNLWKLQQNIYTFPFNCITDNKVCDSAFSRQALKLINECLTKNIFLSLSSKAFLQELVNHLYHLEVILLDIICVNKKLCFLNNLVQWNLWTQLYVQFKGIFWNCHIFSRFWLYPSQEGRGRQCGASETSSCLFMGRSEIEVKLGSPSNTILRILSVKGGRGVPPKSVTYFLDQN